MTALPAPLLHASRDERVALPASHIDLLERPARGVLTTLGPDGQPHSSLVAVDHDGELARVDLASDTESARDLGADPRVSLLVVDPKDTTRFIQVRGDAELATEHAEGGQPRATWRVHARRITLDAIHG